MAPPAASAPQRGERGGATPGPMAPIYRVTLMSWCFQFLLDLLWIPLAAYFKDLGLGLHVLGLVFAANLGVRIVPNVLATRLGVRTDMVCMLVGLVGFGVNLVWPEETWAILAMSAAGGLTFVRAHLSVHGKLAAGSSVESLTLAARWSGAARNFGTVVAFVVPVALYQALGWRAVVATAMCVMCLYLALAAAQHRSYPSGAKGGAPPYGEGPEEPALVEEAPREHVPWIDWLIAGAFCVTELQMNIQAAAVPTTLLVLGVPLPLVGGVQAAGQLIAMGFLVLLSRGACPCLQKRPTNLLLSFAGTFVGMAALWLARASEVDGSLGAVVLGLYFFYACAYTAQVTMLECLTGVLDMSNSIYVMGVSEVVGCACSLVGGYLGPALLERNPSAPFALEAAIALATTLALGIGLGLRACDQYVACQTTSEYRAALAEQERLAGLPKALHGLRHLHRRPESYIGVEQRLRRAQTEGSLVSVGGSSTAADTEGSLVSVDSSLSGDGATAAAAPGGGLNAPLLGGGGGAALGPHAEAWRAQQEAPPPLGGGRHQRVRTEPLAILQVAVSTHQAREYKRALASFGQAPVGLDRRDYAVERDPEQPAVPSHGRSMSCRA